MWPMLRHNCPHCHHCSTVKYTPAVFSQSYFCEECHQSSTNSVHIVTSAEERMAQQQDRELASLFSSNMTLSEHSLPPLRPLQQSQPQQQATQAQPIPIPSIFTSSSPSSPASNTFGSPELLMSMDTTTTATPILSSSSSSPSSTTSSLVHHPPLPPPMSAQKPVDFQQYQYYPSMHYTPSYSAYPSTQSSELMLRRRKEDELARLENMVMERRGFAAGTAPAIAVNVGAADGMDLDI